MLNTFMWPSVVAILGIATLLILRQAWIGLIGRISRISPTGASFERPERMQEGRNPQGALSFQDLMKIPISASVLQREEIIKQQFHGLNLKNDVEKMEILVRAFAMSRIEMEFNNISNFIFGSQVTLLVQLSSTRNPITTTQTQSIFNQAKSTFSTIHEGRTLNEWLRYLITNNLVIQEDETIQITQYGTDFLKHLLDARLAYERPG